MIMISVRMISEILKGLCATMDARHDVPIKVELLDLVTGERKWTDETWSKFCTWWWTEGNGSCDCNRALAFDHDGEDQCETVRYVVVDVKPLLKGYTLDDFNIGYPDRG